MRTKIGIIRIGMLFWAYIYPVIDKFLVGLL